MNAHRAVALVVCFAASIVAAIAQQRLDAGRMYERIYAIVPMVGTGTEADPKRPMFLPTPQQIRSQIQSEAQAGIRTGIIAFASVVSDDGNSALVEIVTATKTDMAALKAQIATQMAAPAATSSPNIQVFDRSATSPTDVQAAFSALKKGFDISALRVVVP